MATPTPSMSTRGPVPIAIDARIQLLGEPAPLGKRVRHGQACQQRTAGRFSKRFTYDVTRDAAWRQPRAVQNLTTYRTPSPVNRWLVPAAAGIVACGIPR